MAIIGCIADDFTGASDAASFLSRGGLQVQLYNGTPIRDIPPEAQAQAMVIALKSRTQNTADAVADSTAAARFLLRHGVKQIYFKYCSTFDSTPKGNIGPVADALMELTGAPYTLLVPSLPVNGRTVRDGSLYVNGVPLHKSPMRNHPLTPMLDCRLDRLMAPQSRYPCRTLPRDVLQGGVPAPWSDMPFYWIPDYETEEDGALIADAFWSLPLLTGGSGLLMPLAQQWTKTLPAAASRRVCGAAGPALLLAGSCAQATLDQIAWYRSQGNPCCKLDPQAVLDGSQTLDSVWSFVARHTDVGSTVLVYSSDTPEQVRRAQKLGRERVAARLEQFIAQLASAAVRAGYTRIITAGGETSGSVTKSLGFSAYWIGESVAPGVPIMIPVDRPELRLVLKSGNFGQEDFFGRALDMTRD